MFNILAKRTAQFISSRTAIFNRAIYCGCITFSIVLFLPFVTIAQPQEARQLEKQVYSFNNKFQYDSSQIAIRAFLSRPNVSAENKYYGFLYLSYTYKRLFNYKATLQYLDSAQREGMRTTYPDYFLNIIICQKAFAYFDVNDYAKADSLMTYLKKDGYKNIDGENLSKLYMQEAYLMYKQQKYTTAEKLYLQALQLMIRWSPCDQPMILGKLMELYGAQKQLAKMKLMYQKAVAIADSCQITKYMLYANETMALALETAGEYKSALIYTHLRDSLRTLYNEQGHQYKLIEMEAAYKDAIQDNQIKLQQKSIQSKNLQILLLIVGMAGLAMAALYYLLRQQKNKLARNKQNIERFTSQLLHKTEDDRKRIAGHLHDSVNHELLYIKNLLNGTMPAASSRIDTLIDEVRNISHNLHPVVFSKIGLAHSIAQLTERVQVANDFMLTAEIDYKKNLDLDRELQLYRIIQEGVTNMIKHSDAIAGIIYINHNSTFVDVTIKDNGKGFNVDAVLNSDKAFGLHNMIERARAAGGQAIIRSDNTGTIIHFKIPIHP